MMLISFSSHVVEIWKVFFGELGSLLCLAITTASIWTLSDLKNWNVFLPEKESWLESGCKFERLVQIFRAIAANLDDVTSVVASK